MPALAELPMIRVVHPAYHCRPNGGHGSFWPSANLRLSCGRVLATAQKKCQSLDVEGRISIGMGARSHTFGGICDGCQERCGLANKLARRRQQREPWWTLTNLNGAGS